MRDQLSKYLPAEDHRAILSRRKLFELAGLAVASAAIPPGMAALATARPASSNSLRRERIDRKSTRLNSSHGYISYAVFCLKKKKDITARRTRHPSIHVERALPCVGGPVLPLLSLIPPLDRVPEIVPATSRAGPPSVWHTQL